MDLTKAGFELFGNCLIDTRDNKVYINGTEATSEQIEQIEVKAKENVLWDAKSAKKQYIKENKERYINRPIQTSKGLFFGGLEAMSQYVELKALGESLGLTKGNVPSVNGIVVLSSTEIDELIKGLRMQNYKGTVKMFHYYDAINACTTIKELDAIVWEDIRNA